MKTNVKEKNFANEEGPLELMQDGVTGGDASEQMMADYKMNIVVDEKSGCWNWVGDLTIYGFPAYWDDHGKNLLDYLYCAAMHDYGPDTISRGKLLLSCKNKRCVNPAHLVSVPWSIYFGQPPEYR